MSTFEWAPLELRALLRYEGGKLKVSCSEVGCSALRITAGKGAVVKKIEKGLMDSLMLCREHGAAWGKFSKEQIESWPKDHKQCKSCRVVLPFEMFHKHKQALFGYAVECKICRKPASKEGWLGRTFEQTMLAASKHRAQKRGIPHTITIDDIVIPEKCPILGVNIQLIRGSRYAPSLDQIEPNKGYTPDNIIVMSHRANQLKSNISKEEAALLNKWMQENCSGWTNVRA